MNTRNIVTFGTFCVLLVAAVVAGKVPQKHSPGSPNQHGLDLARLPQNIAVYVGATVTFTCWVSEASANFHRVQWTEFAYSTNGEILSDGDIILPAHPQSDRYSLVRDDPNQYDLVIANVTLNDGGAYSCFDASAPGTEKQRAAAELIVIAGPQNCSGTIPADGSVIEGHYHTMECTLEYKGNIIPSARWEGPQPFDQSQFNRRTTVWNGLSFYARRTMAQQFWTSRFNFTNNFHPVPVDTAAANVPEFLNLFHTVTLTVYWSPENMYAVPIKSYYLVGDTIQCFADAFPTPSYEWHNLRTNERFPGSLLTIPQNWEGFEQWLRCGAVNTIGDLPYSSDLYIPVNVPARSRNRRSHEDDESEEKVY